MMASTSRSSPNTIDSLEVGPGELPDIYATQELKLLAQDLPMQDRGTKSISIGKTLEQ